MIWRKQAYKDLRERTAQMTKTKRAGAPKASKPKRHDEQGADQRNRLTRKRAGAGGGEPVSKRLAKPRETGARFMEKGGFKRNKEPPLGNFQQGGASSSGAPKAKAKAAPRPPSPPPPRRNRSKKPPKKGG